MTCSHTVDTVVCFFPPKIYFQKRLNICDKLMTLVRFINQSEVLHFKNVFMTDFHLPSLIQQQYSVFIAHALH